MATFQGTEGSYENTKLEDDLHYLACDLPDVALCPALVGETHSPLLFFLLKLVVPFMGALSERNLQIHE